MLKWCKHSYVIEIWSAFIPWPWHEDEYSRWVQSLQMITIRKFLSKYGGLSGYNISNQHANICHFFSAGSNFMHTLAPRVGTVSQESLNFYTIDPLKD